MKKIVNRVVAVFLSLSLIFGLGVADTGALAAFAGKEVLRVNDDPTSALKSLISKYDLASNPISGSDKLRIQKREINGVKDQEIYFVTKTLKSKNAKVKYAVNDMDKSGVTELLALYPNGNLEFYEYDPKMVSLDSASKYKPIITIKKVKEVRKKNNKGAFIVRISKKKYVTYTYSFSASKVKKGKTLKKKFAKKFKKLKKIGMSSVVYDDYPLYHDTDYMYMSNGYYNKLDSDGSFDGGDIHIIMKSDGENYRAMLDGDRMKARFVFGANSRDDFNSLLVSELGMKITGFINIFGEIMNGNPIYPVTSYAPATNGGYAHYVIVPNYSDGTDGDLYYQVTVNESSGKIVAFEEVYSTGLVGTRYDFISGDAAQIDGEQYTVGLDDMCYDAERYAVYNDGVSVRNLTVEYAGVKQNIKVTSDIMFLPYTVGGSFSITLDNNSVVDPVKYMYSDPDMYSSINYMLNPSIGGGKYADAKSELIWKA